MNITMRDLFNYLNPSRTYSRFLKDHSLGDVDMPEMIEFADSDAAVVYRSQVLEAKQQGTLAGEQVQHNRSDDEVGCGD